MDHYRTMPESPVGGYTLVHGPDGFNAMADSFEDAVTFTCRLDDQLAEIERLRKAAKLADEMYEQAATQANDYSAENAALRVEVERLQAELVELRALADKRTRDERDGWCERNGECWLADGPCAGHRRGKASPLLQNIAADDERLAEQEEEG